MKNCKSNDMTDVISVKNLIWANLSDRAYSRVVKAAQRRHLSVDEFLQRTASNVLRYGEARRYDASSTY